MKTYIPFAVLTLLLCANTVARGDQPPEFWIAKLGSDKPSEFRIAQVYLSRFDIATLDKLDALARTADDRVKQRMKEIVAMMLLNGVELRDVQRRQHLYALCQVEFAKAHELAVQLTKAVAKAERDNQVDAGELLSYHLGKNVSDWRNELFLLHGWAVPALLELTESRSPFLKMLAIDTVLVSHGARLPATVMERLKNDPTPLVRWHGDYSTETTIAKEIAAIIKSHSQLAEQTSDSDSHLSLRLLHEFEKIELQKDYVLTSHEPKWSFDEFWRAAQQDMVRLWDPRAVKQPRAEKSKDYVMPRHRARWRQRGRRW